MIEVRQLQRNEGGKWARVTAKNRLKPSTLSAGTELEGASRELGRSRLEPSRTRRPLRFDRSSLPFNHGWPDAKGIIASLTIRMSVRQLDLLGIEGVQAGPAVDQERGAGHV